MADKTPAATEEDGGKKKGGKMKLIIIAVVVVVLAGAGWFFFMRGPSKPAPPTPGVILQVDPITVNLAGGGYLKIAVGLQFTASASANKEAPPDPSKAADAIIAQYSQADPNAVNNARAQMAASLQDRIEKAYDGAVFKVYLTQYVTQ